MSGDQTEAQPNGAAAVPLGAPRYAVATDVGLVRANNEDAYLTAPPLFAVADGMGGHQAGEVAAAGAIETLHAQAGHDTDSLVAAVEAANRVVFEKATSTPELAGMGTTITALLAHGQSVQIVHVGDSRAYLLRERRLRRLTQDHTVVDRLAREGKIAPEEVDRHPQRSVLERALGVGPEIDIDVQLIDVHAGDRLLLCTDGLSSMLHDEDIRAVLQAKRDPQVAARSLVEEALRAGGKDNVTVVVIDFPPAGDSGPDPNATAEQPPLDLPVAPASPGRPGRGVGGPGSAQGSVGGTTQVVSRGGLDILGSQASRSEPPPNASPPTTGMFWSKPRGRLTPASPTSDPSGSPPETPFVLPGRERRPAGIRLLIAVTIILPLLVIALLAGRAAVRSSWFVGQHNGQVTIFRGLPGSFAGLHLQSVVASTGVAMSSLPAEEQSRVRNGINASSRADAQRIAANLPTVASTPDTGLDLTPAVPTGTVGSAIPSPSPAIVPPAATSKSP